MSGIMSRLKTALRLARQPARTRHGVARGRSRYHQTRRGQDAVQMSALDCLVDPIVQTEIVSREDQRTLRKPGLARHHAS
jgi:hypothetical protein